MVTYRGKPVADGVLVIAIFTGGPTTHTATRHGRYSLKLLAARCADGLHWISFRLVAGTYQEYVFPRQRALRWDIALFERPRTYKEVAQESSVVTPAHCPLVLGRVRGRVTVRGRPVPDGTEVLAVVGAGHGPLNQTARVREGWYEVSSVGNCEGFMEVALWVKGQVFRVQPTGADERFDLSLP